LFFAFNLQFFTNGAVNEFKLLESPQVIDFNDVKEIKSIIRNEPISVSSNVAFLFSNKSEIYPFPVNIEKSNFIVLNLKAPYNNENHNPFSNIFATNYYDYNGLVFDLIENTPYFEVIYWKDDWLVLVAI
jgi:hypothetical protein